MTFRQSSLRSAILAVTGLAASGVLYAQPSQGDFEIGGAGSFIVQNTSPSSGTFFADISAGKYWKDNQYIGGYALPSITFSTATGGATFGSFGVGGEYEYGFKLANDKLWPFVGAAAGLGVTRASAVGVTSWSTSFQLIPEGGIKYFLDNKTSVEIVAQFPINFASGGTTSSTQILFGLRHIL